MFYTFYDDTFNIVCICEIEIVDVIWRLLWIIFTGEVFEKRWFLTLCDERFELIQFEWEIFENFIIEKTNIEYQY